MYKQWALLKSTVILLLITSCGGGLLKKDKVVKQDASRLHNSTDPDLLSYVNKFEEAAKIELGNQNYSVGDIPVNFGDPGKDFQGVCYEYLPSGKKEIILRQEWWKSASESFRESLIFHELGHCALDREHDNETIIVSGKEYKTSLMNAFIVKPGIYLEYKSEYRKELFSQDKNSLVESFNEPKNRPSATSL